MENEFMEILKDSLFSLAMAAVPVLVAFLVKIIRTYSAKLQAQTNQDWVDEYIKIAEDAILAAVKATNQTFVDLQKADGVFDKEQWVVAFNKTKGDVLGILTETQKAALAQIYGDLDSWINVKIEAAVVDAKK